MSQRSGGGAFKVLMGKLRSPETYYYAGDMTNDQLDRIHPHSKYCLLRELTIPDV